MPSGRGLRYDDEIVALGWLPGADGERVQERARHAAGGLAGAAGLPPLPGRRSEMLVRLAGVHLPLPPNSLRIAAAGLTPDPPATPPERAGRVSSLRLPPPVKLPESVQGLLTNRGPDPPTHRLASGPRSRAGGASRRADPPPIVAAWVFTGSLAAGGTFRISLTDDKAVIDLPTGTTRVRGPGRTGTGAESPGSGGMLAALILMRRLLREDPTQIGRTDYRGTTPVPPAPDSPQRLTAAGDDQSDLTGTARRPADGRGGRRVSHRHRRPTAASWPSTCGPSRMPNRARSAALAACRPRRPPGCRPWMEVRRGGELFGIFRIRVDHVSRRTGIMIARVVRGIGRRRSAVIALAMHRGGGDAEATIATAARKVVKIPQPPAASAASSPTRPASSSPCALQDTCSRC